MRRPAAASRDAVVVVEQPPEQRRAVVRPRDAVEQRPKGLVFGFHGRLYARSMTENQQAGATLLPTIRQANAGRTTEQISHFCPMHHCTAGAPQGRKGGCLNRLPLRRDRRRATLLVA